MKPHLRYIMLAMLGALAGCGGLKPSQDIRDEAAAYFADEGHRTEIAKLWFADNLPESFLCGEMEPAADGHRHRFYYDRAGKRGQAEWSDVVTFDAMGSGLVAENRRLFDKLWMDHCEPFRPIF